MSFDLQPTLKGKLVSLRPLEPTDFDMLYEAGSDPLIWEQHPLHSRYKLANFRTFFDDAISSGGALIAHDAETNGVIGSSRFHGLDENKSEIEIGWSFLARSHWGGTYNGDMKRLMLHHAFRYVKTVVLLIHSSNIRSQRATEKIGGIRNGWRKAGEGTPCFLYEVTEESMIEQMRSGEHIN